MSFEELANPALSNLQAFIDVEKEIIAEEHGLEVKLLSWESIWNHLDEVIPTELEGLNGKIFDLIIEIREFMEREQIRDIRLEKEEEELLAQLKEEVEHKEWRAVKRGLHEEKVKEKKAVRLHQEELHFLHSKFEAMLELMGAKEWRTAGKHLRVFQEIYRFIVVYEKAFRHLLKKEEMLRG